MSRFFAGVSDTESESQSDDEQVVHRPVAAQFSFSDDEVESKRVVRSAKEKRYEELSNVIKNIRNYRKIKDMSSILTSFEELARVFSKAQPVILKEENGVIPRFIIRSFVELQDFINEVWDDHDSRRNLSKNNKKSLEILRQRSRKYIKEFEEEIAKFKEAPFDDDDEEEEKKPDDDDSSDDEEVAPVPKGVSFKKDPVEKPIKPAKLDDESDESEYWGTSTDSDSDSSEGDQQYLNYRDKFLKKTTDKEEKEDDVEKRRKKTQEGKERRKKAKDDDDVGWELVTERGRVPAEKPKMFAKDAEIDCNLVLNKVHEIVAARGKKRTDRRQQIELLYELKGIAEQHNLGEAISVKICFNIVSAIFDYNPKVNEPMKPELWTQLLEMMQEMMKILLATDSITMSEAVLDDSEEYEKAPYFIRGCPLTAAERLDDEFTKLLKECDPHSNDYMERLKDEMTVTKIIDLVLIYEERLKNNDIEICRIYLRKIDHLYYKFDPTVFKKRKAELPADTRTSVDEMEKLCRFIYSKDNTDRLRTRAILSHIYHHALHDNWFQARDLLLMSHLQETIEHSDPPTQILYNRTMANLGLCAFRQGNIMHAHLCLVDLMMTSKPKELLAQGLLPQRQHERSLEQEKVEKQRQMPFHMHINLELLECVYLVSAMILEIPYMAAHEFDGRRRMISKTFYQQLRSSERQPLVGPPDSMREHVVAAAKAMRCGNWKACATFIVNKKMNAKVWDLFHDADSVREMITKFIKENSLSTYLFTYSNVYSSISIPQLAALFELSKEKVHSLISKMIINEEVMASLDDPTETVVMHRSKPSRLQALSMQLADKVTILTDSNVKIFEIKQGNFMHRGNQGNKGQGGPRGERGNYRNQDGQNRNWNNNRRDNRNWKGNRDNRHHQNKHQNQNNNQNHHINDED